jgi:peptidoglycan/LPS O-acetylase OafA/YrhL
VSQCSRIPRGIDKNHPVNTPEIIVAHKAPSGRRRAQMRYIPALDGLRAVAVFSVLLYHNDELGWFKGGYLGVDVFFVISGYLITSLLFAEWLNKGGVSFRAFYARRARRLLPALYLVLFASLTYAAIHDHSIIPQTRGDSVAAFFYVTNWWLVFQKISYVEFSGAPPLLKHLWSLAVEEQFYLIWPPVFFIAMKKWNKHRGRLVVALLAAAALSIYLMSVVFDIHDPATPAYFRTDTHAFGLLFGCALGMVWVPWRLTKRVKPGARIVYETAAIAALFVIIFGIHSYGFFDDGTFPNAFVIVSLASVVAIAALAHPASSIGQYVLGQKWLVWLGQRSYGIYLWHILVFAIVDQSVLGIPALFLRLLVTVLVAEVSYRYVESPFRHGLIASVRTRLQTLPRPERARLLSAVIGIVLVIAVMLGVLTVGLANAKIPGSAPGIDTNTTTTTLPPIVTAKTTTPTVAPVTTAGTGVTVSTTATTQPAVVQPAIAVGDSVMLGAANALRRHIPGIIVDAEVSKQFADSTLNNPSIISVVQAFGIAGRFGNVVIVHGGTNGRFTDSDLAALMNILKGIKRVVLVNDKEPRSWAAPNNAVLANNLSKYPNAVLVDWSSIGAAHPEYFVKDLIHLTDAGQDAYATAIAAAIVGPPQAPPK